MNLIKWIFGKKKETKKDCVATTKQNFRHITAYKSDSIIHETIERKRLDDDIILTTLSMPQTLIDNDSINNSSIYYGSNDNEVKGFDGGFGGGDFSGGGSGGSFEDNSSGYDSSSNYDSGSSISNW